MFSKIGSLYTPDIWESFLGQVISALGIYMIYPFLTVYLNIHLHIPLMATMAVMSIAPVMGFFSVLVAGPLADRFGRKPVMVLSLFGLAVAMLLYGFARNAWEFAAITAIDGMFGALYRPALNAWVTDTVAEDRRTEVFSFLRVGVNMGAAAGPAIGAFLLLAEPGLLFDMAAICVALTAAVLWVFLPESRPPGRGTARITDPPGRDLMVGDEWQNRRRCGLPDDYRLIIALTLLNLPVALFYAQAGTNLPIHLSHHFANYTQVIAILYLFGASMVVVLQMLVSRLVRNAPVWVIIALSYLAFGIASFGYAWASSVGILLVTEFVFTCGEMVGLPQLSHIISLIAPEDKRALCFSIFDSRWRMGDILGPLWGGWLMTAVGGANSFRITGLLVLMGGIGTVVLLRRLTLSRNAQVEVNLTR